MTDFHFLQHYLAEAQPRIAAYGLWAVGLGTLCETLLFVGLFVPGFSMLVAAGYFAASGQLSVPATLAVAMSGGFIGDQTAYLLGRALGGRMFARHGPKLERLRNALTREGGWILLWYHYAAPLRVVMPYLAGSTRYPRARWMLLDTLGLAGWVGFGFGLGYLAEGPLKRYGDTGYYVIFGGIALMLLFTLWRVVRLLLRREGAEDLLGEELDAAGKFVRPGSKTAPPEGGDPNSP